MKLDHVWVMEITEQLGRTRALQLATRTLHSRGLSVVAQGVHTRREWDAVCAAGCDRAMGYYLSPPQGSVDLDQWFRVSTWRPRPIDTRAMAI